MNINNYSFDKYESEPTTEKMSSTKDVQYNKDVRRQSKAARQARKNARGRFWS